VYHFFILALYMLSLLVPQCHTISLKFKERIRKIIFPVCLIEHIAMQQARAWRYNSTHSYSEHYTETFGPFYASGLSTPWYWLKRTPGAVGKNLFWAFWWKGKPACPMLGIEPWYSVIPSIGYSHGEWTVVKYSEVKCCEVQWSEVMWCAVNWSDTTWSEVMCSEVTWCALKWSYMMWSEW
jgi:hypothetical protein